MYYSGMSTKSLYSDLFSAVTKKEVKVNINRLFGNSNGLNVFQLENAATRCGCYLCQARNLNGETDTPVPAWVPPVANTKDDQARGTSGISPYFAGLNSLTTLDSLETLESPYIDGLMWGAKWGDIDPDSNQTTELEF